MLRVILQNLATNPLPRPSTQMADGCVLQKKKWCNELATSADTFSELHVERVVRKFLYRWQSGSLSRRRGVSRCGWRKPPDVEVRRECNE
jgi:hypothetical protein